MFKSLFSRLSSRILNKASLLATLIIPLWMTQKNYRLENPSQPRIIKNNHKSELQIQYSTVIPERISDYDDKNVIVYFMSGDQEEDELVKQLLTKYKTSYNQNIYVIFINPSIQPHGLQLHHTFLTKRNYSKDINRISFKAELDKLNPQQFTNSIIKKLQKYIHTMPEVDQQNITRVIPNTKSPKVILKSDKNSPDYKKHRILFQNFMEKPFAFKMIQFMIVADEEAAKILGIDSSAEGTIHMLMPVENEFLKQQSQNNFIKLGNHEFSLVKEITNDQSLKDNFIFMPFLNHTFDHILELKVNRNKISREEKQKIFEICKKISHPIHITFANILKKYQLHYSQHDDLSYKILKEEMPEMSIQQKTAHLTKPKQWQYKGNFNIDQIQQWIQRIKRGEVEPHYKSQPTPKIDMHSHKLTGKNFQEILVSTDNEVVFFYSNSCHNCARFGELYEDLAKNNYSDDKLVMNNIQIQQNQMECGYNTPLTPTLSFFKLESKTRPFNYDLKKLSKDGIKNFIQITKDVKLVDDQLFNKFIEGRQGYNYEL